MGLEIMTPEHVADVVRPVAATERVQGAQWVIWPGQEPCPYQPDPAIDRPAVP